MYYAHKDAPETRREKITSCITMIVVVVLIFLGVAWILFSLATAKRMHPRVACQNNLLQISAALESYQTGYRGYYPSDLELSLAEGSLDSSVVYCPLHKGSREACKSAQAVFDEAKRRGLSPQEIAIVLRGAAPPLDYIYVRYKTREDAADVPIVYDKAENHEKESRYVLFGDGHVEWIPEEKLFQRFEKEAERVPAFKVYLDRYGIEGDGAS